MESNKSKVDGELHQEGCTRVQYFSSPTIPVLSGVPLEPRRGRPSPPSSLMKALGIDRLSLDDRIALMHALWDNIVAEAKELPLTETQKQDLQRRLADYQAHRYAGATWEEVKARLEE